MGAESEGRVKDSICERKSKIVMKSELLEIFRIADSIDQYDGFLKGKTIVMFFPAPTHKPATYPGTYA